MSVLYSPARQLCKMNEKIVSIIGPTATGKTALALWLAEKFSEKFSVINIVSADSRQVYIGMEVGTGVDVPNDFVKKSDDAFPYPFWQKKNIRMHGLSFLRPTDEWSVTHFKNFAEAIIEKSFAEDALAILVGGTGLYHNLLFSHEEGLYVKPNAEVRDAANKMSVSELQEWLKKIDKRVFDRMNHSDQMNPRRLIRKIEIALSDGNQPQKKEVIKRVQSTIGLTDTINHIKEKIRQRIEDRLEHGMIDEVQKLIAHYPEKEWKLPAFSATGYKEVRAFLEDKISKEEMEELWLRREVQYAKRQMTWWKKQENIQWFDVSEKDWQKQALASIVETYQDFLKGVL